MYEGLIGTVVESLACLIWLFRSNYVVEPYYSL